MKYRSKPQEVEAIQWTGENYWDVCGFVDQSPQETLRVRRNPPLLGVSGNLCLLAGKDGAQEWVPVPRGHWIVRLPGDLSDHWPVDPVYFEQKYEVVP